MLFSVIAICIVSKTTEIICIAHKFYHLFTPFYRKCTEIRNGS